MTHMHPPKRTSRLRKPAAWTALALLCASFTRAPASPVSAGKPPDKVKFYTPTAREMQEPGATLPLKVNRGEAKALLVAWSDFSKIRSISPRQKRIENYSLFISRTRDSYIVHLVPLMVFHARYVALGGGSEYGREYRYVMSQKDYKITKRQDYK